MPLRPPLLLIFGGGDEADQITRSGQRTYVTGSSDLGRLLPEDIVRHRLVVTPDYFRRSDHPRLKNYPVIVNMITEAEHNVSILEQLDDLLNEVPGRVVNRPAAVLRSTRDQVAQLLSDIPGLIAPKTVRLRGEDPSAARALANAGLAPPIILRRAGTHGGKFVGVFDSVELAIDALAPGRDHIATQFTDFRSEDGLYRKFRIFFIGPHRILRHMLIADTWIVHGHARAEFMLPRPALIDEERARFESDNPFPPEIEAIFDTIRERIPLDFFGLDFALMRDGQVVLFEANATMSFMPNLFDPRFEYLPRCIPLARAAFMELLGLSE